MYNDEAYLLWVLHKFGRIYVYMYVYCIIKGAIKLVQYKIFLVIVPWRKLLRSIQKTTSAESKYLSKNTKIKQVEKDKIANTHTDKQTST